MNAGLLEKCLLLLSAYMINYNERKLWLHHSRQKEQSIHLHVTSTARRTKGGFPSPPFWTPIIYKLGAVFLPEQQPCESRNHSKRNPFPLASHPPHLAHKTSLLKINNICTEQAEIQLPPSTNACSHRESPTESNSMSELYCTHQNPESLGSVITTAERHLCQGHAAKWPANQPRLSSVSPSWLHISQVSAGKAQLHPPALRSGFTPSVCVMFFSLRVQQTDFCSPYSF